MCRLWRPGCDHNLCIAFSEIGSTPQILFWISRWIMGRRIYLFKYTWLVRWKPATPRDAAAWPAQHLLPSFRMVILGIALHVGNRRHQVLKEVKLLLEFNALLSEKEPDSTLFKKQDTKHNPPPPITRASPKISAVGRTTRGSLTGVTWSWSSRFGTVSLGRLLSEGTPKTALEHVLKFSQGTLWRTLQ